MRDTSIEAYRDILDSLSSKRSMVLTALIELETATDREISAHLMIPINEVTGRRNELEKLGYIIAVKKVTRNKRSVYLWKPSTKVVV